MGINMIDTAHGYRTETAVGRAIQNTPREKLVISSKHGYLDAERSLLTAEAFQRGLDESLRNLGLETLDIYFIHGLQLPYYQVSLERFLPVLEKARQAGKIRFIGVTEAFETDTRHEMLRRAVQDDCWDVMMVGFNLINPSARISVLPATQRKGIGTLGMFAVRRALIDEARLRTLLGRLVEAGELDLSIQDEPNLMAYLDLEGVCDSLTEAAYRFCAYETGLDCVLCGTSEASHLQANLAAVAKGPLPEKTSSRLAEIFGKIDSVSGQIR
jgi:aryl-alcohol dehydrogenase-like predicted oxidoreductase